MQDIITGFCGIIIILYKNKLKKKKDLLLENSVNNGVGGLPGGWLTVCGPSHGVRLEEDDHGVPGRCGRPGLVPRVVQSQNGPKVLAAITQDLLT